MGSLGTPFQVDPSDAVTTLSLTHSQLDALVLGLKWQRIGEAGGLLHS